MKRNTIVEIISALLILIFLYAGVSKFLDFKVFIHDMDSQPFPNWMTPLIIWGVPIVEIVISIALIFNKTRKIGLWASFVLMSLFTIYTSTVLLHFFGNIPCSCGGVIKSLSWKQHMVFNLFFEVISLAGILLIRKNKGTTTNSIYIKIFHA